MQSKSGSKAEAVLQAIRDAAKENFLPIIDYSAGGKGEFLEELVRKKKPRMVLEIGTLVGYSAIKIIRNLPKDSKLVTLEVNPASASVAKQNLKRAEMDGKATIVVGSALQTIPKLKGKFDFVFIDASKEDYINYLLLLEKHRLLDKKATILADNVKMFKAEVADYLEYVRTTGGYKSSYHDFGEDAMEVSEKK